MSTFLREVDRVVNIVKTVALANQDYLPFLERYRELSSAHTSPDLERAGSRLACLVAKNAISIGAIGLMNQLLAKIAGLLSRQ